MSSMSRSLRLRLFAFDLCSVTTVRDDNAFDDVTDSGFAVARGSATGCDSGFNFLTELEEADDETLTEVFAKAACVSAFDGDTTCFVCSFAIALSRCVTEATLFARCF